MELERFPKAMPLRDERGACAEREEMLSARGWAARVPVRAGDSRATLSPGALTRPPGRSGGTSATMAWLGGSLGTVAGRLLPALLDMSELGL